MKKMMLSVENATTTTLSVDAYKLIKSALNYYLKTSHFRVLLNQATTSFEDLYQQASFHILVKKDDDGTSRLDKFDSSKGIFSKYIFVLVRNFLKDVLGSFNSSHRLINFNIISYDSVVVSFGDGDITVKDTLIAEDNTEEKYSEIEFYEYYKSILDEFEYSVFESLIQGFNIAEISSKLNSSRYYVEMAIDSIRSLVVLPSRS